MKSIDLPASVETIGYYAFNPSRDFPDSVLTAINVDEANPHFKSVDGVLYTKDGKTLVDYPAAKSGEFVIPDGVTAIQQGAFQLAQITSLTIPEGVTELSEDAFCICPNLSSVTLPQSLVTAENLEDDDNSDSTPSEPTNSDSTSSEPTTSDTTSSEPTTSDTTSSTPTTSDKNNPNTGVAAVATGLVVLAGAAVLVTRKKTK